VGGAAGLVPEEIRREQAQADFRGTYEHWRAEYLAAHPALRIENIRFEHDPDWRGYVLSVQGIRSGLVESLGMVFYHPTRVVVAYVEGLVWETLFWRARRKALLGKIAKGASATGPKVGYRWGYGI
jgi:hypothetical protein